MTNHTPILENKQVNLDLALSLAKGGWFIFPCKPDKSPYTTHGKNDATTDPEVIRSWWLKWPDALLGIYCSKSGFFALDIDNKNSVNGSRSWAELVETQGAGQPVQAGPIQSTPSGGFHVLFKYPQGQVIPNNASKLGPGLDLRSNGYICSGEPYAWLDDHGPDTPLIDAPTWLLDLICKQDKPRAAAPGPITTSGGDPGSYWLKRYLARANVGNRNDIGFFLACQLRDSGLVESEAESIMQDYARRAPGEGYTEREALASLKSAYHGARREAAHLPGLANSKNGHYTGSDKTSPPDAPIDQPTTILPTPGFFKCDDIGNGERFAHRHGTRLRYVKEWGWLVWNGKCWEQDRGILARLAKETARSIFAEAAAANDDNISKALARHANATASKARREAMIDACISEPGISVAPKDFDGDPWLLNLKNGILDLRNGELRPHNSQEMFTKIAGTYYESNSTCPRWIDFLERIFEGNQAIIDFLQRAIGYSLTGDTGEQCLFFLHGTGKNGKSTFTGILQALLGDLANKTLTDTLMVRKFDGGINNDLARLAGSRVVIAAELAEGKWLNESLIKDLTGGDTITARFLHKEYFEFIPTFKLWMYGNHKPIIRGTDEGIWRRMKLIPFNVTIPEPERDPILPQKLAAELPGILSWAINGCQAWQSQGLNTPSEVNAATANYRSEQDTISQFLTDSCKLETGYIVTAGELFEAYKAWGGELKQRRFSQSMAERGFTTKGRDAKGRAIYQGIGLIYAEN